VAPLRVALLGCGALAQILATRVYPKVAGAVAPAAAVDVQPERAAALGEALGAPAYGSLLEACSEVEIDGVDVRLPHHLHLEGARLAAEAGLPFLIEKPMATSIDDACEVAALAQAVDGPCGVSENYGFLEPVRAAQKLLDSKAIGELLAVQSARVFELGQEWRRDGWRVSAAGPAGVIVDQATHVARLLRTTVGEIVEVHAYASDRREGWTGHDSAAVACRFASGHIGTQLYCWASPAPAGAETTPELSLYGSEGWLSVHLSYEGIGGGAFLRRPGRADQWHGTGTNYYDSLAATLEDWASALRAGREPSCSLREGLADVAVMAAIQESAASGRPVSVASARDLLA
jgi:predicted dehydrogenase